MEKVVFSGVGESVREPVKAVVAEILILVAGTRLLGRGGGGGGKVFGAAAAAGSG